MKSHDDETIVIEEKEMEDILKEMNKEVNIKEGQNLQDNEESCSLIACIIQWNSSS